MMDTQLLTIVNIVIIDWRSLSKTWLWIQHDPTIVSSHLLLGWFHNLKLWKVTLRLQLALYQVYVLGVPWSPWTHPWLIRRGPSIPTVKHTLQIPRTDQTIHPKNDLQSAATVALLRCSTKNMDLFSVGILAAKPYWESPWHRSKWVGRDINMHKHDVDICRPSGDPTWQGKSPMKTLSISCSDKGGCYDFQERFSSATHTSFWSSAFILCSNHNRNRPRHPSPLGLVASPRGRATRTQKPNTM